MLTKKQNQLLHFINDSFTKNGITPSYDEMRIALDLQSKSGIHRLILSLEERGFIKRLPNRARAIEICKLPNQNNLNNVDSTKSQSIKASQNYNDMPAENDFNNIKKIDVLGKIAAGTPIEAISNPNDHLYIPSFSFKSSKKHYALIVDGDSMIEAGIHDGDTVVIEETNSALNGDIVVALINDLEATLKKYQRTGNKIHLISENKNYEDQIYDLEQIKIQGKLASLFRVY